MRTSTVAAMVALASLWMGTAGEAQTLYDRETLQPIFIPATAIFTENGAFRSDVPAGWREQMRSDAAFAASVRARVRVRIGALSDLQPCGGVSLAEPDWEFLVRRDSRETAVTNAVAIFVGTVDRITPGLFHASPSSVLRLVDVTSLKEGGAYDNVRDELFVRHPYAHFQAGQTEYCSAMETRAHAPAVGDRVLVFAYDHPPDEFGVFVPSASSDLIVERPQGGGYVPPSLSFFAGEGTLARITAAITKILSSEREHAGR